MKIYKFGGASVRDAENVKNIGRILRAQPEDLVVVISAMGKMTNALELLCNRWFHQSGDTEEAFEGIKSYHEGVIAGLFSKDNREGYAKTKELFNELHAIISSEPTESYDYEYDRIIPFGELISTTIVSAYLKQEGMKAEFVDIRRCLQTDKNYRDANIDMAVSGALTQKTFTFKNTPLYITQGFIAGTRSGETTTLGREGSDYTAAILANLLEAESVTIWKDVPGFMNADPKLYAGTVIVPELSYREAIELSNFGAKIIHPKTIKPLQNKKIPLYVKSFLAPQEPGSVIREWNEKLALPPIFINKGNLLLLTLTPRDFSFIAEEKLSRIFALLAKYRLHLNLMQNSAISFTLLIDNNEALIRTFIDELKAEYKVLYNTEVQLITIRHYDERTIRELTEGKTVLVEQRSRLTARFVVEGKQRNN